jgi:hypothetical protein
MLDFSAVQLRDRPRPLPGVLRRCMTFEVEMPLVDGCLSGYVGVRYVNVGWLVRSWTRAYVGLTTAEPVEC